MTKDEWKTVALGDLIEPAQTWNPAKSPSDDTFNYIDLSAVDQDAKIITASREVTCGEAPSRARQLVASGDVLVSTVRPNLNGVAQVPVELDGATASTGFCVLRAREAKLDARYLFQWVKASEFIDDMVRKATGASYPAVSDRIIFDSRIPLPPLAEQRRIAEVLDRAEALRAKRRAALAELDSLTQSLFLDIFGKKLEGPPVDTRLNRNDVPKGCSWQLLTDVARLATGHTPDRERADYWNGDIPWMSLTDIRSLDGTVATKTLQNVTPLGIDNSSSVLLPKGTVCFSRTASVGFVTVMGLEMATSQDFMNWVCGPNLDPIYLMWALIMSRQRLLALSSGSTHRTIYMRVVEQFRVLLPPIALQQEFARRVGAVEKLKQAQRAALAEQDALFATLQHRAFRGEL
jgi:type I restriction enzyme S subunit